MVHTNFAKIRELVDGRIELKRRVLPLARGEGNAVCEAWEALSASLAGTIGLLQHIELIDKSCDALAELVIIRNIMVEAVSFERKLWHV